MIGIIFCFFSSSTAAASSLFTARLGGGWLRGMGRYWWWLLLVLFLVGSGSLTLPPGEKRQERFLGNKRLERFLRSCARNDSRGTNIVRRGSRRTSREKRVEGRGGCDGGSFKYIYIRFHHDGFSHDLLLVLFSNSCCCSFPPPVRPSALLACPPRCGPVKSDLFKAILAKFSALAIMLQSSRKGSKESSPETKDYKDIKVGRCNGGVRVLPPGTEAPFFRVYRTKSSIVACFVK